MKPVSCTSTISQQAPPIKPIRGEYLAQRNPSKKRATTKNFLRLLIRASFSLVFAGGPDFLSTELVMPSRINRFTEFAA